MTNLVRLVCFEGIFKLVMLVDQLNTGWEPSQNHLTTIYSCSFISY